MNEVQKAAVSYARRDWWPIPVKPREKRPIHTSWQHTAYADADALIEAFEGGVNIGVILGPRSAGLADVDLDCPEALDVGELLLRKFNTLTMGRQSRNQPSHYLFRLPDLTGEGVHLQWKDPTDAKVLIELRAHNRKQTVMPPSEYAEGDRSVWYSGDDAELLELNTDDLQGLLNQLAAVVLLARHWPTEGGRHDAYMALAGGLLQGGAAPERVHSIFAGIIHATGDQESDDRMRALSDTVEAIDQGRKVMSWGSLARLVPDPILEKVREWLGVMDHRFTQRMTLAELAEIEIPPIKWVFENVIPLESITWLHGVAGEGKTIVAMHIAIEAINAGLSVLHLDAEMGARLMARRAQTMLHFVEAGALERYVYVDEEPPSGDEAAWFLSKVRTEAPDFIIIDPYVSWLSRQGLSENESTENRQLFDAFLKPLKQELGCTVIVLDHEAKGEDGRKSARGSGDKMGSTDLAYSLSTQTPFSPADRGKIRFTRTKNRLGLDTEAVQYFMIGGGEPLESARADGLTALQHNVREHVRAYAGANATELAGHLGMDKGNLSKVLGKLIGAEEIEVQVDGRSKRYYPASNTTIDLSDGDT